MSFESGMDIWLRFDKYTPHYYFDVVLMNLHFKDHYSKLISLYAEKKKSDPPRSLSMEYLDENSKWLSRRNILFLEHAKETYQASLRASKHIKPMLYHYSWHSFFAFLMYTFLRFDSVARGHGITVSKMESNEITLEFHPRGFFQRILDVLTIFGYPLAFSPWILVVDNDRPTFVENSFSSIQNIKKLNVEKVVEFDDYDYLRYLQSKFKIGFSLHYLLGMNKYIKDFILLFTASNISRYKPHVWDTILDGESRYESMLLTGVREAYESYVRFVITMHSTKFRKY